MLKPVIVAIILFGLALVMTMTGRGGGNFYVLTLVLAGVPMHTAAATGQFILFTTALAAAFIFQKYRVVSIPLALLIGVPTAGMAFAGGFLAHLFAGATLKMVFACLLVAAGVLMLRPVRERTTQRKHGIGYCHLTTRGDVYVIALWVVIPVALAAGFCAGMVGVSGGSFLVPLMVLACGVPMHIAVGTASALVAVTAFAGFLGHALHGSFDATWAFPLAPATIAGGILGGRIALRTKPMYLKTLFAVTTLAAAVLMVVNALAAR